MSEALFHSNWNFTTLFEVCRAGGGNIQTGPFGSQLHAKDYVEFGIPSIMPKNIGDNNVIETDIARISEEDAKRLSKYLVQEGDVVYSRRGDVEKRALITKKETGWLCGTGCLRVRFGPRAIVDPRFASHYLGHPAVREWIVRHAVGATMPNLNTSILGDLPFLLPPLDIQKNIADQLTLIESKIQNNNQINETLESIAKGIFKDWFIDFGPVKAKAEGKRSFGIDEETAAIFPDSFEESEFGLIPKGWKTSNVDELINIHSGGTPKTSEPSYWNGNIKWFSVVDSPKASDVWVIETQKQISELGLANSAAKILRKGITVISARGTVGNLALVGSPMAMNQSCYGIETKIHDGDYFTYYILKNSVSNLKGSAHGSVFDTITRDTFKVVRCCIPPERLIAAFEKIASPIMNRILNNLNENSTLISLRDLLLPKLISGEVSMKDNK